MTSLAFVLLFLVGGQPSESFNSLLLRLKLLPIEQRSGAVTQFLASSRTCPIIEGGSIVHFVWFGKAKTVVVSGDLQRGWSAPDTMESIECEGSSLFFRSYFLPPDSRLDYQFVVDGKWGTDPRNPRTAPSGYGLHSELAMPQFVSNPDLVFRPNVPRGSLDSMVWKCKDDSIRQRVIRIYTPNGYGSMTGLPSLYVHDGNEALAHEMFGILLDNLIGDRTIKPILVVFIPPIKREAEYVGSKQRAFTKMLCDDLVPLVDKSYKTSHRPEDRAMMGISNGGHLSLATVLKRPDVFLNAVGQSSTITPQLLEILDNAVEHLTSHRPFGVYIDVGTFDLDYPGADASFLSANRDFSLELTKSGIKHTYREVNDGHEWASWRERTEDILRLFFGMK